MMQEKSMMVPVMMTERFARDLVVRDLLFIVKSHACIHPQHGYVASLSLSRIVKKQVHCSKYLL